MIASERLELRSLDLELLGLIHARRRDAVERALGLAVPDGWMASVPTEFRIEQLLLDPSELPWLTRAMVAREPRRLVGTIGFHGRPDERGRVEVGYEVLAAERRRGYAREAIRALAAWAGQRGARALVASVSPANAPSLALVASLGLVRVGEQIDAIDGLEFVFERPLPLA